MLVEAYEIGATLTGLYGRMFKTLTIQVDDKHIINAIKIKLMLFEISQQYHSSLVTRKNMIETVGTRICEIATTLYPHVTLDDKFENFNY